MIGKHCPAWMKKVLLTAAATGVFVGVSVCSVSAEEQNADEKTDITQLMNTNLSVGNSESGEMQQTKPGDEEGMIVVSQEKENSGVNIPEETKTLEENLEGEEESNGEAVEGKEQLEQAAGDDTETSEGNSEGKDESAGENINDESTGAGQTEGKSESTTVVQDEENKTNAAELSQNLQAAEAENQTMPVQQSVAAEEPIMKSAAPKEKAQISPTPVEMYRMYNPYTGEHLYTANVIERNSLAMTGWNYEGVMWYAPNKSKTPVYRLYNPFDGGHMYTTDANEQRVLISMGWNDEGIGWYSDDNRSVALYRQFNPYAVGSEAVGAHNYTPDMNENNTLVSIGWRAEGIGWYGMSYAGLTISNPMTIYDGYDYAAVYDYTWYRDHNPDVTAYYGDGDDVLLKHFVEFGMKEERQAKQSFDEKSYRYAYPDLRRAFYSDYEKYYRHYCENGRYEGRIATGVTKLQNPVTDYNGIQYSPIYDYAWFVANHQDLVRELGTDNDTDLIRRFAEKWIFENVQAKASYDQAKYEELKQKSDPFYATVASVLNQVGWDLRAAFNWVAKGPYVRMYNFDSLTTRQLAEIYFRQKGGCYEMAAAFCELARALGYDAHQMSGYVPSSSGGLTEHSWVEIDQNGATYVCDPDFVYDMARKGRVVNGYMFAYRTSGTWMYTRYYRMS